MSLTSPSSDDRVVVVNQIERWEIYRRLQELQIPCQCSPNQPLRVQLSTPTAAIQFWSVVKQLTTSRSELLSWLYKCWQIQTEEGRS